MKFCNLNINIEKKENLFQTKNSIKVIIPVNAQIINMTNNNARLMDCINQHDATFDGEVPLKVARFLDSNFKNVEKLSGSDIVYDFCEFAKKNNMKIFFLGGNEESNIRAVDNVKITYGIEVDGFSPKYEEYPFSSQFVDECFEVLKKSQSDIVFVGFGVPKQEFFIQDYLNDFERCGVKYVVASGGTIDFVAGIFKRAPQWVSRLGLEGFYRLAKEPSINRIQRIYYSFGFLKYLKREPTFRQ